jgi:hypothetical protein
MPTYPRSVRHRAFSNLWPVFERSGGIVLLCLQNIRSTVASEEGEAMVSNFIGWRSWPSSSCRIEVIPRDHPLTRISRNILRSRRCRWITGSWLRETTFALRAEKSPLLNDRRRDRNSAVLLCEEEVPIPNEYRRQTRNGRSEEKRVIEMPQSREVYEEANARNRSGTEFAFPKEYCDMVLGIFFQRSVRRRSNALSGLRDCLGRSEGRKCTNLKRLRWWYFSERN